MASPDLRRYVDLTFFDRDPQDIFDAAIADLKLKIAEWTPREGNVEVLLLESMAVQVAEAVFAINRLPGAIVAAMLRLALLEPDPGVQPTTDLKFSVSDLLGHTIPAGTSVRLPLPDGMPSVVFTTDEALVIDPGEDWGVVAATGTTFTASANGTAVGTNMDLLDSVYYVNLVETAAAIVDGVDPETTDEWIERGINRFARLTDALTLARHFVAIAKEDPRVVRANAIDNWNSDDGTPGDHPGHLTVVVYGDDAVLSSEAKDELAATFQTYAQANLAVHIVDPVITPVDVTVSVVAAPGYSSTAAEASAVAALEEFLSPATWDWDRKVQKEELVAVVNRAEGVLYVSLMTVPEVDVDLAGAPGQGLADAGTITVTAVAES